MHAIPKETPKIVDKEMYIGCMRCVWVCPQQARAIPAENRETFLPYMTSVCAVERKTACIREGRKQKGRDLDASH